MSYLGQEISIEGGAPVELYEFDIGTEVRYYTSSDGDVNPGGGQVYTAVAVQRGETSEGGNAREDEVQVTLPASDVVSQLYAARLPGVRLSLVIKRYHRTDVSEEVVTVFEGNTISGSFRNNAAECVISARSSIGGQQSTLPRRTYRSLCNHTLYDSICAINRNDPSFKGTSVSVSGTSGNVVMVTGIGAFNDGWFTGGEIESLDGTGDRRLILNHSVSTLTLLSPFFIAPATVNLYAGCDHSAVTCAVKFLNRARFGGFDSVPTKDPFRKLL